MTCPHKKTSYVRRDFGELYGLYDENGEAYTEEAWETVWTTVDLDTHRYKCTQCGEVMFYSERARRFYEDGKGELT